MKKNILKNTIKAFLSSIFYLGLFLSSSLSHATPLNPLKMYVMGHLDLVTDWDAFDRDLKVLKDGGFDAVTVDVWWGVVQKHGLSSFDWSYYDQLLNHIEKAGLKQVSILSYHQAGGNVGDGPTYIPVPDEVRRNPSAGYEYFRGFDEKGKISTVRNVEATSVWFDEAYMYFERLAVSYQHHLKATKKTHVIEKIYVGMGPAGELRYPSYNSSVGWTFPQIGEIPAFSRRALLMYRDFLKKKYQDIQKLNVAWSRNFASFDSEEILPPISGEAFFRHEKDTRSGLDFLEFYQKSLLNHLDKMLQVHTRAFADLKNEQTGVKIPIGVKLAGVHWRMFEQYGSHLAETAAGYVNGDYRPFLGLLKKHHADLTFTCFEMKDNMDPSISSAAQSLVLKMARLTKEFGINLSGENALTMWSEGDHWQMKQNVTLAGHEETLRSMTLLRMENYVSHGHPTAMMENFQKYLRPFTQGPLTCNRIHL